MQKAKIYYLLAGILNLFTALLHLIGGQIDLVYPLMDSNMQTQLKAEWTGVWHMVTIMLFFSSYLFIDTSIRRTSPQNGVKAKPQHKVIQWLGILYILFAIPFITSSLLLQSFAPQWILLLPIGILAVIGSQQQPASPVLA
ncbi:MAG: hypothetical protein MRY78_14080 [Saprospiraceae bacterium]|nr:hypothetical protein [Saprospiraceae bacterium]